MYRSIACLLLLISLRTFAQWSTDPAAPLVVSTNTGAPDQLHALSDGADGWLVFWRDKRVDGTRFDIFGQHLNAAGEALWDPNGRLVHHEGSSSISLFTVQRSGSTLYFAINSTAGSFQDSLKVFATDLEVAPLWDRPVLITYAGAAVSILYVDQIKLTPTSDGVILGWYDVYFGGSSGINVTRIDHTGEVLWQPNGYAIPSAGHGPFTLAPDGADGVMVNWRTSNGIGAGYLAMRVDSSGANAWDANVATNQGAAGFGGNHQLVQGAHADMLFTYVDQTNKVKLCGLDTLGAPVFDPPTLAVCGYTSSQGQVSAVQDNDITTVIWGDGRPPAANHDVYMQRINADGDQLLDADGVLVMHLNTYIPTTGLVPSLNGGIIATIDSHMAGLSAMRMEADGTPAWPAPVAFCTPTNNPLYEKQIQLPDGTGGIVSFWSTSANAILGARIDANGSLGDHTGIDEASRAASLRVFPNPATAQLIVDLPAEAVILQAELISAAGSSSRVHLQGHQLDLNALATGAYTLRLHTANTVYTARFIKP